MKLSTKGRYSVTALYELALHYGGGTFALHQIAENQAISENYLEQLMVPLRKAGLVESVRGAQGGYQLARQPAEITIGDIITAVEGPIALTDCLLSASKDKEPNCARAGHCITREIWAEVCDSINAVLEGITLRDLIERNAGK